MRILAIVLYLLLTVIFLSPLSYSSGAMAETMVKGQSNIEESKIQFLIDTVKNSNVIFIRNGREYSPSEAAIHIAHKRMVGGSRIKTAQQFVDGAASSSSLSGEPYFVELPNGEKFTARVWLNEQLKKFPKSSQEN